MGFWCVGLNPIHCMGARGVLALLKQHCLKNVVQSTYFDARDTERLKSKVNFKIIKKVMVDRKK